MFKGVLWGHSTARNDQQDRTHKSQTHRRDLCSCSFWYHGMWALLLHRTAKRPCNIPSPLVGLPDPPRKDNIPRTAYVDSLIGMYAYYVIRMYEA